MAIPTDLKLRLNALYEQSIEILISKLSGGEIVVENEASLQLQFAYILKILGELYIRHPSEVFSIELEKPIFLKNAESKFLKSGTRKANLDIWLSLQNKHTEKHCKCAIELKFFKKKNHREPNNRYDVFKDISNLENYYDHADLGFMLVVTDHDHYVLQEKYSTDTSDFDFRDGATYKARTDLIYNTKKPYGEPIRLNSNYSFMWKEITSTLKLLSVPIDIKPSP